MNLFAGFGGRLSVSHSVALYMLAKGVFLMDLFIAITALLGSLSNVLFSAS